jgi:hypothetical protein
MGSGAENSESASQRDRAFRTASPLPSKKALPRNVGDRQNIRHHVALTRRLANLLIS